MSVEPVGFSKSQAETLNTALTGALLSGINLLSIELYSDVENVATLSLKTNNARISFDILDTGDAVCYIIYLEEGKSNAVQYMSHDKEKYISLFERFLMENPNDQRP
jgi:hypothetical protein